MPEYNDILLMPELKCGGGEKPQANKTPIIMPNPILFMFMVKIRKRHHRRLYLNYDGR